VHRNERIFRSSEPPGSLRTRGIDPIPSLYGATMHFNYLKVGRTARVYVVGVNGFDGCRVWYERAEDGGCRLHCPKPPPGLYRSLMEISDELRAEMLRQGYDVAMMSFDEMLRLSIRPR
jgi:hypothetical protein